MLILRLAITLICLFILAFVLGDVFVTPDNSRCPGMRIATGLVVMWALFYFVSIPVILLYKGEYQMTFLVTAYSAILGVFAAIGLILMVVRPFIFKNKPDKKKLFYGISFSKLDNAGIVYLSIFLALLIYQLVKTVFFAYADGDDAYYVSVAQYLGNGGEGIYRYDPYTGVATGFNSRYALAPFPVWIACISRISGIHPTTISHILMPLFLIPVTYVIYNAIGARLFENDRNKKYMFLALMAVFVMFSHYSYNASEVFLLTRARQGKEALGNIVIPFLFLILFENCKKEQWNITWKSYITIIFIEISGGLCSVFGNLLVLVLLFAGFIYTFFRKVRWWERIKLASLAVPPLLLLLLYVIC